MKAIQWIFSEGNNVTGVTGSSGEEGSVVAQSVDRGCPESGSESQLPHLLLSWWGWLEWAFGPTLGVTAWWPWRWLRGIMVPADGGAAPSPHTNRKVGRQAWVGHDLQWDFSHSLTSLGLIILPLARRARPTPSQSPNCYRSWWHNSPYHLFLDKAKKKEVNLSLAANKVSHFPTQ